MIKANAETLLNENLVVFPMLSYTGEYLTIISNEMSLALSGDTTVEEAAQLVQEQVEALAAE